jgi:hypothetical protein
MNWNPRITENAAVEVEGTGRSGDNKTMVTRGKDGKMFLTIYVRNNGKVHKFMEVEIRPVFNHEDTKKQEGDIMINVKMELQDGNSNTLETRFKR